MDPQYMRVGRFDEHLQRLLNAREVPLRYTDAPTDRSIAVDVRLVWEVDGESWQPGQAMAWTRTLVLVHLKNELRLQTLGAWVPATDVRRR